MDKSWMQNWRSRLFNKEYKEGVKYFMQKAQTVVGSDNKVRCPCWVCANGDFHSLSRVEEHLFVHGMLPSYTRWVFHGESYTIEEVFRQRRPQTVETDNTRIHELLHDVEVEQIVAHDNIEEFGGVEGEARQNTSGGEQFNNLFADANKELYPGCKSFSKLKFIIRLLHIKTTRNLSNKAINDLIGLIKEALPNGETLPHNYYEAKTLLRKLGFFYEKIDACKNDCILYWKQYEQEHQCPQCHESRYVHSNTKGKPIPQKVLCHFLLKPRLQRLFASKENARDMHWHAEVRLQEPNVLRHPADSEQWVGFNNDYPWFAADPRNIRLGLASDGFNPFSNMNHYFMLSLLIPGPTSPSNDIDVYLRPLVEELKDLWNEGIRTYDAYKGEIFTMHAAVLWTINDFPAYGSLSGWSTKGKLACPTCMHETHSFRLKHGRKECYMGHRRYLSRDHKWQKDKKVDGKQELRTTPVPQSGSDMERKLNELSFFPFGKNQMAKKRKRIPTTLNWRKKSIFFELKYWSSLKLRHNLDVMLIEKNICDNILGTILNIFGKSKDSMNARLDLEHMGVKKELHLRRHGDSISMPHASYTLTQAERKQFCEWLSKIKFPDGYASNISRWVNTRATSLSGLKSHDCHVMLQRLLPVILRGLLSRNVATPIIEFGLFFKELCSRNLNIDVLKRLEADIILILCKLEQIFSLAFFDVMVHLAVHLPREALLCGPVQYRWMYPVERFLRKLKISVRNKARPEGSIAEAYIDNETLTYCSMYIDGVETKFNRADRNYDGDPDEHECLLQQLDMSNLEERHENQFVDWFKVKVKDLVNEGKLDICSDIYNLSFGPTSACRYSSCIINGKRIHTEKLEKCR
ncbi:hypothetical protein H6P81_002484 [Aristolochia fimbriata]|uniref:Transposase n=1 Tax=Aristolochia fimbriata TaxID=158543 RepID=A0AAV7FD37_ARIFI|nr:hypothetical protein H6P81_002484 [Aristolochia fimbriata]